MRREESLKSELAADKIDAEKIVLLIKADPSLVDSVLRELSNKAARVRFGCSKSLLVLSEKRPDLLYPKVEKIIGLLESENQVLKWNAIAMLGNLAALDQGRKIRAVLQRFYGFLSSGELITANNAIAALGKIGRAFPEERKSIVLHLLGIGKAVFDTDECRNIAIGKSILAIEMFLDPAEARKEVLDFVKSQTDNRRKATAEKAKAFLHKFQAAAHS